MSITTKFIVSVFSICFLAIGAIFFWTQNAKGNDLEIPSISQQSETDDKTSQNEQLRAETPKKRPFLIKRHARQPVIPKKQVLSRPVNDAILPLQLTPDIQAFLDPMHNDAILPLQLTPDIQAFLDPIHNDAILPLQLKHEIQAFLDPMQVDITLDITLAVIMDKYKQGKINFEYVVDFLESQHIYKPAILEKLEPRRAFRYLAVTSITMSESRSRNIAKTYAERILAKDPDNPDAQLHMVRYEEDKTKIIDLYRQILTKHPNHPNTLSALGYRLLDHSPEEAIQYLKKANLLDPTLGLMGLGEAYERLGDVKTAWFCYNKNIENRKRRKGRFPPSRIHFDFYVDEMNLRDIAGGRYWRSAIKWVPDPNGNKNRRVMVFEPVDAKQEREIREFYQFRDWVRNIESRKLVNRKNDFLVREVEKHLEGGKPMFDPERIVRTYEITTQYPGNEGIQRLKKTDPEVALEIERLLQEQKKN